MNFKRILTSFVVMSACLSPMSAVLSQNSNASSATSIDQKVGRQTTSSTMDVGLRAFKNWQKGWQTGDLAAYLAMTTDKFSFWFPAGKHRGQFSGAEGKARMVAKCREHTGAKDRLTFKPYRIIGNNNTVVFEFESEGTIGGKPYKGRNVISLDVEGEKISGFREYFGDFGA